MKRYFFTIAIILVFALSASAQRDDSTRKRREYRYREDEVMTLFGRHRSAGAYGAFSVGYSTIDNYQAVLFGGKFEWITGHSLGFGFGGNGFINEYHYDAILDRDVFLTGGYGGIVIEPILFPRLPVHLSFPVTLGAGGISYITRENTYYQNIVEDSEAFLVAEPSGEIEFNITRHFRLAAGVSYRFTSPFNIGLNGAAQVSSQALENWSYYLTFKFGRF